MDTVEIHHKVQINGLQISIGIILLLLGTLVYLIDRPPDNTYFIYASKISLHNTFPNLFGVLGNNLPDFVHVISFILITAGILSCRKKGYIIICSAWVLAECAFELGQKFNPLNIKFISDWCEKVQVFGACESYFRFGTFDYLDMVAITAGGITAYIILLKTMDRRKITCKEKWF